MNQYDLLPGIYYHSKEKREFLGVIPLVSCNLLHLASCYTYYISCAVPQEGYFGERTGRRLFKYKYWVQGCVLLLPHTTTCTGNVYMLSLCSKTDIYVYCIHANHTRFSGILLSTGKQSVLLAYQDFKILNFHIPCFSQFGVYACACQTFQSQNAKDFVNHMVPIINGKWLHNS